MPVTSSDATAAVWSAGLALDWSAAGARGRKISLPTYPFQRTRCWIDPTDRDEAPPPRLVSPVPSTAGPAARCGDAGARVGAAGRDHRHLPRAVGRHRHRSRGGVRRARLRLPAAGTSRPRHRKEVPDEDHLPAIAERDDIGGGAGRASRAGPAGPQPAAVTRTRDTGRGNVRRRDQRLSFAAQLEAMQALFAEQLRALHGQSPAPEPEPEPADSRRTGRRTADARPSPRPGQERASHAAAAGLHQDFGATHQCAHAAGQGAHAARPRRAGRSAHGGGLPARMEGARLSDRRRAGQGLEDLGHRRQRVCRPRERLRPDHVRALARLRHRSRRRAARGGLRDRPADPAGRRGRRAGPRDDRQASA